MREEDENLPGPPPTPVSLPNREENRGETLETTTEVEIESSGGGNASSKATAGRQPAAAAKPPITKIITKNNDIITINKGLNPLSLPQHPNTTIFPKPDTNYIHPCTPNHNTPTLHTAITTPTPTTTPQSKYLDPEGT